MNFLLVTFPRQRQLENVFFHNVERDRVQHGNISHVCVCLSSLQ